MDTHSYINKIHNKCVCLSLYLSMYTFKYIYLTSIHIQKHIYIFLKASGYVFISSPLLNAHFQEEGEQETPAMGGTCPLHPRVKFVAPPPILY